jgi:hypothetical protein
LIAGFSSLQEIKDKNRNNSSEVRVVGNVFIWKKQNSKYKCFHSFRLAIFKDSLSQ